MAQSFAAKIIDFIDEAMSIYAKPTGETIKYITDEDIDQMAYNLELIVSEYAVAYIEIKRKACKKMVKKFRKMHNKSRERKRNQCQQDRKDHST